MTLRKAVGLGALSGMRSMTPLAVLGDYLANNPNSDYEGTILGVLNDPRISNALKIAAAGEMIGDKMPFTPNRTDPMPVFGRAFIGALLGAAVAEEGKRLRYAALGALAAVIGAMFGYGIRSTLGGILRIPDPLLGIAEDVLVVATARAIIEEM
jgi:uncharacterized membrane protein